MLKGFELLYAYLDQNSIRWTEPDESVYIAISCVEKELKRTKRALWLARAERAHARASMLRYMWHVLAYIKNSRDKEFMKKLLVEYEIWLNVERKCRAYADKFKENG